MEGERLGVGFDKEALAATGDEDEFEAKITDLVELGDEGMAYTAGA